MRFHSLTGFITFSGLLLLSACSKPSSNSTAAPAESTSQTVVLYTSLNEPTARAVLDIFERKSGIQIKLRSDTERDKTVGLVRTLIEERSRPQADVFWNSETAQTIRLKDEGVLEALDPPPAGYERIPEIWRDPELVWFGFAARARVLIVNTQMVSEAQRPGSIHDLTAPQWKGKAAIVRPVTGTTLTHLTALYQVLGEDATDRFIQAIQENECHLPAGNGRLAQLVGEGQIHFGLTDTSDYRLVRNEGKPVEAIYPDQDGIGTLLIPNTIARVKGGPNPDAARKLIEFLLSDDVERILAHHPRGHIPLKPGIDAPPEVKLPQAFKTMAVNWNEIGHAISTRAEALNRSFK